MYKTQRARSPNVVWKLTLKYVFGPVLAEDSTEVQVETYKSWAIRSGRHKDCQGIRAGNKTRQDGNVTV